jgi:hypothetical protein
VGRRGPVELADLFDAFDVSVTYDKLSHSLELAATVTAELVPAAETLRPKSAATRDVFRGAIPVPLRKSRACGTRGR